MKYDDTDKREGNERPVHPKDVTDKNTASAIAGSMNAYLMLAAAEHGGSTDGALLDVDDEGTDQPT